MDPKNLLPVLTLLFGLMAGWKFWQQGSHHPAARTWATMALIFAAVSLWLRFAG